MPDENHVGAKKGSKKRSLEKERRAREREREGFLRGRRRPREDAEDGRPQLERSLREGRQIEVAVLIAVCKSERVHERWQF